jgi:hypothetical protein
MNTYVWYLQHFDNGLCVICAYSEEEALDILRESCDRTSRHCDYCAAFDTIFGRNKIEMELMNDPNSECYIHDRKWENRHTELRSKLFGEFVKLSQNKSKFYIEPQIVLQPEVFVCIGSDG